MRYVRYLDGRGEAARAADALRRATQVYCKRSPALALFVARRAELPPAVAAAPAEPAAEGSAAAVPLPVPLPDPAAARAEYDRVAGSLAPGLVQCTVQRANFERRQGDTAAACAVYEEALAAAAAELAAAQQAQQQGGGGGGGGAAEKAKAKAASYAFLVVQYAHFLHAVLGEAQRAQQAYADALARAPQCKALWEGAVHLETQLRGEGYVGRVLSLYERATAPLPAKPAAAAGSPRQQPAQEQQQQQQGQENGVAEGGGSGGGGAAAAQPASPPAAAAPARGLTDREREELSERMVAFADLHGTAADLRGAEELHGARFKLPLALVGKKRGDSGGKSSGAKKAAAAAAAAAAAGAGPAGAPALDGAGAAAHAAAAAAAHAAAMDYYGSGAYYGNPYAGYHGGGYYGPGGYYGY